MKVVGIQPVLGAVTAVACLVLAAPADASFPGKPGRIVFDAATTGNTELVYDFDPRTHQRRQLTRRPASCTSTAWWDDGGAEYSPSGRLIAYLHADGCSGPPSADEHKSLWVMRADGSRRRMVSRLEGFQVANGQIAFSPDGRRIAVLAAEVGSIEPTTQLLLDAKTGAVVDRHPWGPRSFRDDARIDWGATGTITIGGARRGALWLTQPRGGSLRQLTFPGRPTAGGWSGADHSPSFSPSGRSVAFARSEGTGDETDPSRDGIWRKQTQGRRGARRLVGSRKYLFYSPVFSPDGRRIAFFTWRGIGLISARTGRPLRTRLRDGRLIGDTCLDWQPRPARPR
jgi:Tol biopolymer transport system component